GKDLDRLTKNAIDYIERFKQLRERIEKRPQEKSIDVIYDDVFGMLGALLKKKSEVLILKEFDEKLVKSGRFPQRFLENLKAISKTKKDIAKSKETKTKKDNLTAKQSKAVDNARKVAAEITTALIEYTQRCDIASMERTRFVLKSKDSSAEVFFLKNIFVVQGSKIQKLNGEKLIKSDTKELQEQLLANQNKESKIDFKALEVLKKIFGEFELVY
ncbi:hypothetical protein KAJ38_01690, partial [Candidatus Pacearchaeota archaeon]|nr:hypothetical protein [Candidatus Pacearchaeota archaeon]